MKYERLYIEDRTWSFPEILVGTDHQCLQTIRFDGLTYRSLYLEVIGILDGSKLLFELKDLRYEHEHSKDLTYYIPMEIVYYFLKRKLSKWNYTSGFFDENLDANDILNDTLNRTYVHIFLDLHKYIKQYPRHVNFDERDISHLSRPMDKIEDSPMETAYPFFKNPREFVMIGLYKKKPKLSLLFTLKNGMYTTTYNSQKFIINPTTVYDRLMNNLGRKYISSRGYNMYLDRHIYITDIVEYFKQNLLKPLTEDMLHDAFNDDILSRKQPEITQHVEVEDEDEFSWGIPNYDSDEETIIDEEETVVDEEE